MSVIVNTCPSNLPIGLDNNMGLNTRNTLSTPPVTIKRAFLQYTNALTPFSIDKYFVVLLKENKSSLKFNILIDKIW